MKKSRVWTAGVLAAGAAMAQVSCQTLDPPATPPVEQLPRALTPGTLPGGAPITISIDAPPAGALLGSGSFSVSGTASVGSAPPVSTDLVLVLDRSGSTSEPGCGGQQNSDGPSDTVLDCEVLAARQIQQQVLAAGSVAHLGLVFFDGNFSISDVSQAAGQQSLAAADADDDHDGELDFAEALDQSSLGPDITSFGSGVIGAGTALAGSTATRKLVVFISDGVNILGPPVASAVTTLPPGTVVNTLVMKSVPMVNDCDSPSLMASPNGNLGQIASLTGGTCVNLPAIEDLPDVAPTLVVSRLTAIKLKVDGNPTPITTVSAPLPRNGPTSVTWSTTVTGLSPGPHQLCATATGTDAGAEGSVEECVTVVVNRPPVAHCRNLSLSAGPSCSASGSIDDGSFDPDGNLVGCTQSPPGPYGLGGTPVTLTCTDAFGASSTCVGTVTVSDIAPPVVTVRPPIVLWPPDHKYVTVSLDQCIASAIDACDGPLPASAGAIVSVTSDEGEDTHGSGNTCNDILLVDATRVKLRAEREGGSDGRVYTINFTVADHNGNPTPASCQVVVPHNPGSDAANSGPALCVGSACGAVPGPSPQCGHGH